METIQEISAVDVKSWLTKYRENERDIDNQIERLENLTSKMTGVGAQVLTDMPRAPSRSGDRMGAMIAQKDELESSIRAAVKRQSQVRDWIEAVLSKLPHSDEKSVIRMRYIDREGWTTVAELMFGSREDYEDKKESYLRRVHRAHSAALQNMAQIMSEDPDMAAPAVW